MPYIMISNFLSGIDDDELVCVTGTLDRVSTSLEAAGCSNANLSEDCSELTVSMSEAIVVFNLVISSEWSLSWQ